MSGASWFSLLFFIVLLSSMLIPMPAAAGGDRFLEFVVVLSNNGSLASKDFVVDVSIGSDWVGWAYYNQLNITDPAILCFNESYSPQPLWIINFTSGQSIHFKLRYTGTLKAGQTAKVTCYIGERGFFVENYNYTQLEGQSKIGETLFDGTDLGKIYVYSSGGHTVEQDSSTGQPAPSLKIYRDINGPTSSGGVSFRVIILKPIYLYSESINLQFSYSVSYNEYDWYTSRDPGLYVDLWNDVNNTWNIVSYTRFLDFSSSSGIRKSGSIGWTTKTLVLSGQNYPKIYIGFSGYWGFYGDSSDYYLNLHLDSIVVYKTNPAITAELGSTLKTTNTIQDHPPNTNTTQQAPVENRTNIINITRVITQYKTSPIIISAIIILLLLTIITTATTRKTIIKR